MAAIDASAVVPLLTFAGREHGTQWVAVNDAVMGGVSQGTPRTGEGMLRFSGNLSLENNGGFASIRTRAFPGDLSGVSAFHLLVRGDGRTYQLRLFTDARHRQSRVSYGASFDTEAGHWISARIPVERLLPSWRGRTLEGPPLDLASVEELGLLIADGQAGAFALDVGSIGIESSLPDRTGG